MSDVDSKDGAGVDIFALDFWIRALPRQRHSWVIAPTGRTEWVCFCLAVSMIFLMLVRNT